jgi:hypothetical protein
MPHRVFCVLSSLEYWWSLQSETKVAHKWRRGLVLQGSSVNSISIGVLNLVAYSPPGEVVSIKKRRRNSNPKTTEKEIKEPGVDS